MNEIITSFAAQLRCAVSEKSFIIKEYIPTEVTPCFEDLWNQKPSEFHISRNSVNLYKLPDE